MTTKPKNSFKNIVAQEQEQCCTVHSKWKA